MVAFCTRCGASIVWASTQTGRRQPFDAHPVPGHAPRGWVLDASGARLSDPARDHSALPRYRLHWATCPRPARRPVPEVVEAEPAPVSQPRDGEAAAGATEWTAARRWITTLSAHLAPRPGPALRRRRLASG